MTLLAPDHRALPLVAFPRRTPDVLSRVIPEFISWFCSLRIAVTVMSVLAVGILTSIITTADPDWWRLHFSKLGTFTDFSGFMFNATLFAAGLLIVWFSRQVRRELVQLSVVRGRRPSRTLTIMMASVGIHMSLTGLIPVNVNEFWHDRAASGITLSFLGILITTIGLWKHVPARLLGMTFGVAGVLVAVIVLFLNGFLSLAALEIAGFGLIFAWIGVFTQCVRGGLSIARARVVVISSSGTPNATTPTSMSATARTPRSATCTPRPLVGRTSHARLRHTRRLRVVPARLSGDNHVLGGRAITHPQTERTPSALPRSARPTASPAARRPATRRLAASRPTRPTHHVRPGTQPASAARPGSGTRRRIPAPANAA